MKFLAIPLISLALIACGGGTEPFASPPIGAIKAAAPSPVKKATTITGGNAVVIHLYQALYGMAPSNALLVDYAFQSNNDASLFARNLTDRFATTNHADLAKLVLDNLRVTATTVPAINAKGESEYALLLDAVKQLFSAYPTMRGQVILNMTNLLGGLESDVTYGVSARSYNSEAEANFLYSSSETASLSRPTIRKSGIFLNYAKIGYYSDQQTVNQDDAFMHGMIDRFKQDGYTGVLFEITVGVSTAGLLQHDLKYDRLLELIDYTKSVGLAAGIMPNWNLNGGNADYLGEWWQSPSPDFKMSNFFNAVNEFYAEYGVKYEKHHLDILYLARGSPVFFTQEYISNWKEIIGKIRQIYNGALTYQIRGVNKDKATSDVDVISVWNYLDAISIEAKPFVSATPIYNIEEVVSGYYYSKLNSSSFMSEVIDAGSKYRLPILLTTVVFSLDNALDGGWDPTKQQAMQTPLPNNPTLQATAFKAFFHAVSNNLYPYATSITVGGYEPWTYIDFGTQPSQNVDPGDWALWKAFGYFDMSRFPIEAESVITQYMSNPSGYRATNVTKAGPANDVIYVKNGSNKIYLNGGYDEVYGGIGNDQIVISPKISGATLSISFSEWIGSSGSDSVTVGFNGAAMGTINITSDSALVSANPGGYWSSLLTLTIPIFDSTALPSISITCSCIHGFVQVADLTYGKAIDPKSAMHTMPVMLTGDTKQPQPQWVYSGDIMTFNLSAQAPQPSTLGSFTYIDGGDGSDTIEFDPPQNQIYFKIAKSSDLTVVTDPKGIYPEVRMKNVEWIRFSDGTVAVQ